MDKVTREKLTAQITHPRGKKIMKTLAEWVAMGLPEQSILGWSGERYVYANGSLWLPGCSGWDGGKSSLSINTLFTLLELPQECQPKCPVWSDLLGETMAHSGWSKYEANPGARFEYLPDGRLRLIDIAFGHLSDPLTLKPTKVEWGPMVEPKFLTWGEMVGRVLLFEEWGGLNVPFASTFVLPSGYNDRLELTWVSPADANDTVKPRGDWFTVNSDGVVVKV